MCKRKQAVELFASIGKKDRAYIKEKAESLWEELSDIDIK